MIWGGVILFILILGTLLIRTPSGSSLYKNNIPQPTSYPIPSTPLPKLYSYPFQSNISLDLSALQRVSNPGVPINMTDKLQVYGTKPLSGTFLANRLGLTETQAVAGPQWSNSNYLVTYYNGQYHIKNLKTTAFHGSLISSDKAVSAAQGYMQQVFGIASNMYSVSSSVVGGEYVMSIDLIINSYHIYHQTGESMITMTIQGNGTLDFINAYDLPVSLSSLDTYPVLQPADAVGEYYTSKNFFQTTTTDSQQILHVKQGIILNNVQVQGSLLGYMYIDGNSTLIPIFVATISGNPGNITYQNSISIRLVIPAVDTHYLDILYPQVSFTPTINTDFPIGHH